MQRISLRLSPIPSLALGRHGIRLRETSPLLKAVRFRRRNLCPNRAIPPRRPARAHRIPPVASRRQGKFPRHPRGAPLAGFAASIVAHAGSPYPGCRLNSLAICRFDTPCACSAAIDCFSDILIWFAIVDSARGKPPAYDSRTLPSLWLVFRRPTLAGFGRPLTRFAAAVAVRTPGTLQRGQFVG